MNINNVVGLPDGTKLEVQLDVGGVLICGTTTPMYRVVEVETDAVLFRGSRGQCFAYCQARQRGLSAEIAYWYGVLGWQDWPRMAQRVQQ